MNLSRQSEGAAPRCASIVGLRRVHWRRHGAALHPSRLEIAFEAEAVRGVWLALHVRSAACCPLVRFGDLGKTFLSPSAPLSKSIGKALDDALAQASVPTISSISAPLSPSP